MMSKKIILGAISGLIVLASANGYAAQSQTSDNVIAREASEGPRGGDRVHTGTHKNGVDAGEFIIAREASEGPRGGDNERPGDRQRRGGRNA